MAVYEQIDQPPTGIFWSPVPEHGLMFSPLVTSWSNGSSIDMTDEAKAAANYGPGSLYKRIRDVSSGLTYYYKRKDPQP